MKKLLVVLSIMVVMLSACDLFNSVVPFIEENGDVTDPDKLPINSAIAIPVFDPRSGTEFKDELEVTITSPHGGTIYYRLDGAKFTAGENPFKIRNTTQVSAIVVKDGKQSERAYADFTKSSNPRVATPTLSPNGGGIDAGSDITIKSVDGATIHYTINDTEATENSTKYTGSFRITGDTMVVRAIATKSGYRDSAEIRVVFTRGVIPGQLATPEFSPNGGDVETGGTITITSEDGGNIYYTKDGSDPTTGSFEYTSPFTIVTTDFDANKEVTVKAIAIGTNAALNSAVATAVFTEKKPAQTYTLSVTSPTGGTIGVANGGTPLSATDKKYTVIAGTVLTVTATPDTNYTFSAWTGASNATSSPVTITMTSDKAIGASFTKDGAVVTPTFTHYGDNEAFDFENTISFESDTSGATFHYTIDGNNPVKGASGTTEGSIVTLSSLPSKDTYTIKVIAVKDNMETSAIATKIFTKGCTLSVTSPTGGTIGVVDKGTGTSLTGVNNKYMVAKGTKLELTAMPTTNYTFSAWTGASTATTSPVTITMDSDKAIGANFLEEYTLRVTSPTGGTIAVSNGGTPLTSVNNEYKVIAGANLEVTATPTTGYTFSAWTGASVATTSPVTITMDSDKTIGANFTKNGSVVTPTFSHEGDNEVFDFTKPITFKSTTSGATFHYTTDGNDPTTNSPSGTNITLPANADDTYTVKVIAVKNNMEASAIATKTFTTGYTLTVDAPINGSIEVTNGGMPSNNKYTVAAGTTIELTARAESNSVFTSWTGASNDTTATVIITMDSDKTIGASFTRNGMVATPTFRHDGDNDAFDFTKPITFESTTSGVTFYYTIDGTDPRTSSTRIMSPSLTLPTNADNTYTVKVIAERINYETSAIATKTFTKIKYTLEVATPTGGSIGVENGGTPSNNKYTVTAGTTIELTATADVDFDFTNWTGASSATASPVTITMTSDKTIGAIFTRDDTVVIPTFAFYWKQLYG